MKTILNISATEFKKIFKDFGVIIILFVAPIFYSFFYPFPYEAEVVRKIPVAVIDEDKTDISRKIIRMLNATEDMSITTAYSSIEEAKQAFYERKIYAIIYIQKNFYKDMVSGMQPSISLFADGSYMIYYSETLASTMTVALTVAAGVKIQKMSMSGIPMKDAYNLQASASVIQKPLYNIAGGYGTYVTPAVFALILQQVMLVAFCMMLGTDYERGYNYPKNIHPVQILFGKSLTYFVFMVLISFYFFKIAMPLQSFPMRVQPLDMALFLTPYFLSIIFLAQALMFFMREREGAVFFIVMTSLPFLFLSGFAWPQFILPDIILWIRYIIPSSSGILGIVQLTQLGASINDVLPSFINLWILTFVYMFLALVSINWSIKIEKIKNTEVQDVKV